jgi:hypothetical protein
MTRKTRLRRVVKDWNHRKAVDQIAALVDREGPLGPERTREMGDRPLLRDARVPRPCSPEGEKADSIKGSGLWVPGA